MYKILEKVEGKFLICYHSKLDDIFSIKNINEIDIIKVKFFPNNEIDENENTRITTKYLREVKNEIRNLINENYDFFNIFEISIFSYFSSTTLKGNLTGQLKVSSSSLYVKSELKVNLI
jgi:hypothetical protein